MHCSTKPTSSKQLDVPETICGGWVIRAGRRLPSNMGARLLVMYRMPAIASSPRCRSMATLIYIHIVLAPTPSADAQGRQVPHRLLPSRSISHNPIRVHRQCLGNLQGQMITYTPLIVNIIAGAVRLDLPLYVDTPILPLALEVDIGDMRNVCKFRIGGEMKLWPGESSARMLENAV